jgi:chromosome segregation ATPase
MKTSRVLPGPNHSELVTEINKQLEAAQEQVSTLQAKVTSLENELSTAILVQQSLSERLQADKMAYDQELESLVAEKSELAVCLKESESLVQKIKSLNSEKATLDAELLRCREQMRSLSEDNDNLKQRLDSLNTDFGVLTSTKADLEAQVKSFQSSQTVDGDQLESLKMDNKHLKVRIEVINFNFYSFLHRLKLSVIASSKRL